LIGTRARSHNSLGKIISFAPERNDAANEARRFIAIHGQCAQLLHVAPRPLVGASISVLPGAAACIL
jgi:hypothetical protein